MRISRREFVSAAASCSAHLVLVAIATQAGARALWAQPHGVVVTREPVGSLEGVGDGVWALVSTPLGGDRTTLSNVGIISRRSGVLAIEGFNQPQGAQWLATKAREVTGRWPTHVVLTHYHADHANGVAGYFAGGETPVVHTTATTRTLVLERNQPADASRRDALKDASAIDAASPSDIDLGGRVVHVIPCAGHTPD